ncbi:MAG: DUF5131 family protein [archaeon]
MKIKEIIVSSCMNKSKIKDYVINPYTGCEHGCKYCYAIFMKKYQNIKDKWGEFIYVKKNCPELLEKELKKNPPGHIWISSVTDPYSPVESKYKMTRKILEVISKSPHKNKFSFEILSKSTLVERDFDLIKEIGIELGMSINNLDKNISKLIEPGAPPPLDRIETLKKAKEYGIKVFGFISPVLPGITNLDEIFRELKFCDFVYVEVLNTRSNGVKRLIPLLRKKFPSTLKKIEYAKNNSDKYYNQIKKEAELLSKKYSINLQAVIYH